MDIRFEYIVIHQKTLVDLLTEVKKNIKKNYVRLTNPEATEKGWRIVMIMKTTVDSLNMIYKKCGAVAAPKNLLEQVDDTGFYVDFDDSGKHYIKIK